MTTIKLNGWGKAGLMISIFWVSLQTIGILMLIAAQTGFAAIIGAVLTGIFHYHIYNQVRENTITQGSYFVASLFGISWLSGWIAGRIARLINRDPQHAS